MELKHQVSPIAPVQISPQFLLSCLLYVGEFIANIFSAIQMKSLLLKKYIVIKKKKIRILYQIENWWRKL